MGKFVEMNFEYGSIQQAYLSYLFFQIVEKAAVSLLNNSNNQSSRAPRTIVSQNVGSIDFWPSLGRLITNKILMCQILACTLYIMAIVNFVAFENLIGQSRFHVPKPTGMLLGFEDPISSRLITSKRRPNYLLPFFF